MHLTLRATLPAAFALVLAARLSADEGMWTFDNPPTKLLKERYGFTPTPEWLDHVRLSSVRFNDGGSGSFVSKTGLVMTNHHVGLGCIQKISTAEKDYVATGYVARTAAEEVPCPDLELNVLVSMEDVTGKVLSSVRAGASDKDAREQRKAATAKIEKSCADATKLRCDVVMLYDGSEFQLYRYRKYTDVRLVFAPEQAIAFYGGDPDNFTFPRYDLDVAIFRVWENGKPVAPSHFLKWSEKGPKENELLFVSGHPGLTGRLATLAEMEFTRDIGYPNYLRSLARRRALLQEYSKRSPESARRAKAALFGVENSLKALGGYQAGLLDPAVTKKKAADEAAFRAAIAKDPELAKSAGDPWAGVAEAYRKAAPRIHEMQLVSFGGSRLLGIAGQIVQLVAEKEKPNETRLEEYRESNLASLEFALFSKAPIYRDLQETTLADQWTEAAERLGTEHSFVKTVLGGKTPLNAATAAVEGTKLDDAEVRRALVKGGRKAVETSTDPMIVVARRIDPAQREIRKFEEDEIDAVVTRAAEKLGPARFKAFGKSVPPDATFTLRLAYGTARGFAAEGTVVPWKTSFYGLYGRSADFDDREPFKLSARWVEKKGALDLATPMNFVLTADIIGGNSGSPVVNAKGELVGLIFDMNIHSLAWRYVYTDEKGRAVAVHSKALTEAIAKVFEAPAIANELMGK
jgi:Peptidase S46